MSTVVDPVEIPPMECPAVLLPTPANLKNMVKQIAAMPAKILAMLEAQGVTITEDENITIQSGDTLSQIAEDNNTTVEALMEDNSSITDPDVIQAGQEIVIKGKITEAAENVLESSLQEVGKLATDEISKLVDEVKQLRKLIETILDVIDAPNFESIGWPDLRAEIGIDKLLQKYPIFIQVKLIELIMSVIPIDVEVTVPPLGIKIDIIKFVTDEDYKSKLVADLTGNGAGILAQIKALVPEALGVGAYTDTVTKLIDSIGPAGADIKKQLAELDPTAEDYKAQVDELIGSAGPLSEDIKTQIADFNPKEMIAGAFMDKVNELKGSIIDPLYAMLPPEWQSFGGEEGLEIPELKGQALIAFIESKMSGLGIGLLFDAFASLISVFDKIWKLLGLPDLPIPLSLDIGAMIAAVVDAAKAKFEAEIKALESLTAAGGLEGLSEDIKSQIADLDPKEMAAGAYTDKVNEIKNSVGLSSEDIKTQIAALDSEALGVEAYTEKVNKLAGMTLGDAKIAAFDKMGEAMLGGLEGLSIAGFDVMSIIGGPIDDPVECLALKKKRICEEIGRFKDNYVLFLLRKWMEIVTKFFSAIGLGALVKFIGMDFCTFLGIIGFPKSIDLSFSDHIKDVGSTITSALPSAFDFTTEETAVMLAASILPSYTAAANQTTFTGVDDDNNTLSYVAGQTTVFKTGVSLEDYVIDETDGDKLLLEDGEDIVFEVSEQYTATNGSSIVLTEAANVGDVIFIIP